MQTINIQKGEKICFRCGNFFKCKQNLNKHLAKSVPCKIKYLDLDRKEVKNNYLSYLPQFIKDFNNKNILKEIVKLDNQCDYCFSLIKYSSHLSHHIKNLCKSPYNPNYFSRSSAKKIKTTIHPINPVKKTERKHLDSKDNLIDIIVLINRQKYPSAFIGEYFTQCHIDNEKNRNVLLNDRTNPKCLQLKEDTNGNLILERGNSNDILYNLVKEDFHHFEAKLSNKAKESESFIRLKETLTGNRNYNDIYLVKHRLEKHYNEMKKTLEEIDGFAEIIAKYEKEPINTVNDMNIESIKTKPKKHRISPESHNEKNNYDFETDSEKSENDDNGYLSRFFRATDIN